MTETDLTIYRVQLDDLEIERISDREPVLDLRLCIGILDLRHMTEALNPLFNLYEDPKRCMTDDAAFDRIPELVGVEELIPDIRLKLLDSKR